MPTKAADDCDPTDAQARHNGVWKNPRFLHTVLSLTGCPVRITVSDGKEFEGIFATFSDQFEVALQLVHEVKDGLEDPENGRFPREDEIFEKMIFTQDKIVTLTTVTDLEAITKGSFATDADITSSKYVNGNGATGSGSLEKSLQPWDHGEDIGAGDHVLLSDEGSGWTPSQMFEKNRALVFGESDYKDDMSQYTTVNVDRSDEVALKRAVELANEIERNPASKNASALENDDEERDIAPWTTTPRDGANAGGQSGGAFSSPHAGNKRQYNQGGGKRGSRSEQPAGGSFRGGRGGGTGSYQPTPPRAGDYGGGRGGMRQPRGGGTAGPIVHERAPSTDWRSAAAPPAQDGQSEWDRSGAKGGASVTGPARRGPTTPVPVTPAAGADVSPTGGQFGYRKPMQKPAHVEKEELKQWSNEFKLRNEPAVQAQTSVPPPPIHAAPPGSYSSAVAVGAKQMTHGQPQQAAPYSAGQQMGSPGAYLQGSPKAAIGGAMNRQQALNRQSSGERQQQKYSPPAGQQPVPHAAAPPPVPLMMHGGYESPSLQQPPPLQQQQLTIQQRGAQAFAGSHRAASFDEAPLPGAASETRTGAPLSRQNSDAVSSTTGGGSGKTEQVKDSKLNINAPEFKPMGKVALASDTAAAVAVASPFTFQQQHVLQPQQSLPGNSFGYANSQQPFYPQMPVFPVLSMTGAGATQAANPVFSAAPPQGPAVYRHQTALQYSSYGGSVTSTQPIFVSAPAQMQPPPNSYTPAAAPQQGIPPPAMLAGPPPQQPSTAIPPPLIGQPPPQQTLNTTMPPPLTPQQKQQMQQPPPTQAVQNGATNGGNLRPKRPAGAAGGQHPGQSATGNMVFTGNMQAAAATGTPLLAAHPQPVVLVSMGAPPNQSAQASQHHAAAHSQMFAQGMPMPNQMYPTHNLKIYPTLNPQCLVQPAQLMHAVSSEQFSALAAAHPAYMQASIGGGGVQYSLAPPTSMQSSTNIPPVSTSSALRQSPPTPQSFAAGYQSAQTPQSPAASQFVYPPGTPLLMLQQSQPAFLSTPSPHMYSHGGAFANSAAFPTTTFIQGHPPELVQLAGPQLSAGTPGFFSIRPTAAFVTTVPTSAATHPTAPHGVPTQAAVMGGAGGGYQIQNT